MSYCKKGESLQAIDFAGFLNNALFRRIDICGEGGIVT
jgi:hypothetical protein